jgi:hypothetical protein
VSDPAPGVSLKKHATSIALILVALGVGFYAYFVDRGSVTDTERKRRENDVFPAYRREDVQRVELAAGGVTLAVGRDLKADGGEVAWRLTSPRVENADPAAVEKLLGAIEFASIVRKVGPGSAAGLDAPRLWGTLDMGRLVYHFALGGPAPSPEGAAYLRVDGEGTYVVSRDLVTALQKGADAYRERTVVPYLSLDLAKLEVAAAAGSFTITRVDATSFLLPDLGLRASRDALDRVWSAFAEMRAEAFLDDAEADRATAGPAFTIRMTPKDAGKPAGELLVGDVCPGHPEDVVVVRKLPTRLSACAPKGVLSGLGIGQAALVDRRLFAAHADEIEELRVESVPAGQRVEIARKGNGWHERAPRDRELERDEAEAATALVNALARAEGTDVARADPKAAFEARARVTVTRAAEGGGDEVVLLGPASVDRGASVRRLADGAVMHLPPDVARKLLPRETAIRARDLFTPPLEGRTPARLAMRCDGVVQELARDNGVWTFHDPKGFAADATTVLQIVDAVARAKAEAWVADADDGTFGFDRSTCRVSLAFEEDAGERTVGLVFGREGEGGVYARLEGEPGVFVVARSVRQALPRWAIDRTGFRVDQAAITGVTLTRAGKRVVLTRSGAELVLADGGVTDVAQRVSDALPALSPDEALHPGPPRPDEGLSPPVLDVRIHLAGDGGARDVHFIVGLTGLRNDTRVHYARLDGVDATFAIAEGRLAPLFDAF